MDINAMLARGYSPGRYYEYDAAIEECYFCGAVGPFDHACSGKDGGIRHRDEWLYGLFYKCFKDEIIGWTTCDQCAKTLLPHVVALRDIYELRRFVNKLERVINDKRYKNNGATTDVTSKRNKRGDERRP